MTWTFRPAEALTVIGKLTAFLPTLSDRKYVLEIKEHREKRSLDSNGYAWVLLSKLAYAMTKEAQGDIAYSKDDMYLIMLERYGQSFLAKIPNRDVEDFKRSVQYFKEHEKLFDENAVYFRVFVGSSNYNTEEMSLFINGIVAECKGLGIPTETPEEQARMLGLWGR